MPSHALAGRDQNGVHRLSPVWRNAIYPLLKAALDYNLILEREQVVAKMDRVKFGRWAHQDLNLGPTDYESAALTN